MLYSNHRLIYPLINIYILLIIYTHQPLKCIKSLYLHIFQILYPNNSLNLPNYPFYIPIFSYQPFSLLIHHLYWYIFYILITFLVYQTTIFIYSHQLFQSTNSSFLYISNKYYFNNVLSLPNHCSYIPRSTY